MPAIASLTLYKVSSEMVNEACMPKTLDHVLVICIVGIDEFNILNDLFVCEFNTFTVSQFQRVVRTPISLAASAMEQRPLAA